MGEERRQARVIREERTVMFHEHPPCALFCCCSSSLSQRPCGGESEALRGWVLPQVLQLVAGRVRIQKPFCPIREPEHFPPAQAGGYRCDPAGQCARRWGKPGKGWMLWEGFCNRVKASTAVPLSSQQAVSTSLHSESLLLLIYQGD